MIGKTISHYKILEKLGEGGMGVVYKAEDTRLKRIVALKFLSDIALGGEEKNRFLREAQAAAALNHPNICTIHAIDEVDGRMFIAMEFIEGQSLREKIEAGPLKIDEAIKFAIQIADGLQAAHEKGITHRDIKSANIMITDKGQAKIMDFGLAKLARGGTTLTKEGMTLGTAAYMSPEQAQGEVVDHRTDIWSLGVVMYEMLTGQLPFRGEYALAVIYAILNKDPEPIAKLRSEVPMVLEHIVEKALAKDCKDRYQQMAEMFGDLQSSTEALKHGQAKVRHAKAKPSKRKPTVVLFGSIATLLVLLIAIGLYFLSRRSKTIDSIAVLPFANLSGDPEQEYFADGMTEELITNLAQAGALKVISRTSVMRYKASDRPLPEIALELGVEAIVGGSVRRAGDQVRITVQLIDATSDAHLWAQSYERNLTNVLSLQGEVARAIVQQVRGKLTPQEEARLLGKRTVNPAAHEAYLQGRYHLDKVTPAELNTAIKYFEEAAEIDSDYAVAYAGLASSYNYLGWIGGIAREVYPKAKQAALKALEIDEALAEAHSVLGYTATHYDWDWAMAERHLLRAIELNPNYAQAHLHYSWYLTSQGRLEDARAAITTASELDPLSLLIHANMSNYFWSKRDFDGMLQQTQRTLDLAPSLTLGLLFSGTAYCGKRRYDDAIMQFEKLVALSGPAFKGYLGYSHARAGHKDKALEILDELKELSRKAYVPSYQCALVFIGLEQFDEALIWLEKAYEERAAPFFPYIRLDFLFDPLRNHPRFQDLVRRLNFPE